MQPNREKYYGYSFKYDNGETGFIAELTEESMVYNLIREKFEDKMVANAEECTENCYYVNDEALLTEKPDSDSGSLETYSIPSETLNKAIEEMKNSSLYKNGITFNEYSELVLMGNSLNLSYSEFGYNTFYVKDLKDAKTGEKILEDTVDEVETFFGGYDNKKIEKIDIEDNLVFKGNAVGVASEGDGYSNAIFLDGTLTFNFNKDNMEEKLDFSFDNFYDFSVSKKDNNITFSNIKANNISERFDGIDEILSNSNNLNPVLSINYYGDNNKPIEMVGGLNIDKSDDRKFNMDISFGAKINK